LVSDLDGCVDINPTVGVTGNDVIDPDTNTWYLTAKTYIDQTLDGPTGRPNGLYYIHAINTVDRRLSNGGCYTYINVIQYKTHVFKFSCNNGVASFNKVGDSPKNNAFILGVGHGTVTSLNDQPGIGLVWTSDVEGSNLRIYNAVPNQGVLNEINSFVTPGTTKFTRPVFGDGIVYQGTTVGYTYAYGSPVNLPLNCTPPNFGAINLNATSSEMTIQCLANTALTITAASLSGNPNFIISGLPSFPLVP